MNKRKQGEAPTEFSVFDYESFIPTEKNPIPYTRIMDFLTVGPFVLETDGSFEREHMYDRDKILLEDYLASDGGEKNIVPVLGAKVKNDYYGNEYLEWKKGFIKWNSLRFDSESDACDPALYATEQRNAVYYAAFFVDCRKNEKAVISYVNSGSSLFVNGEQVDFRPFGTVKGLYGLGYQCPVSFRKGRNLVLFKIRPGYIADTMDISMETCMICPAIGGCGGLYVTSPTMTLAYTGTKEEPRMVFPFFAFAEKDISGASFVCDGTGNSFSDIPAGGCAVARAEIKTEAVRKTVLRTLSLSNNGKTADVPFYFDTIPYDGFEGTEHIFSDFHFDTTYHQEQRTYALGAFHITKSIVENLEDNPDFKAVLSEIDYLHPYYSLYPRHRETVRNAFRDGRAEADCFYNQPNDLTSGGEAFVRNLIYGQLYHRDVLGRISRMYVPGDVFGHFSQISQICAKGGCDMIRWGKLMIGVDEMFRHISPDGTEMIHDKGIVRPVAKRLGINACSHSSEALSYVEAFPRRGDTGWMKNTISNARFSVFSDMGAEIVKCEEENLAAGRSRLDNTSRDITQHHSGVLLTRTDFKQANRLCENLLSSAEKFASVAYIYGAEYPEKLLDKAWRQLLCAQHHDSVTGTNNEISFVDLMAEYRECAETASIVLKTASAYVSALTESKNNDNTVTVFNPVASAAPGVCNIALPHGTENKSVVVTDSSGKEYPVHRNGGRSFFVADNIPATGYENHYISVRDEDPDPVIYGNDEKIENSRFSVTVSAEKGGGIVSVYDKKTGKEFIDTNAPSTANAVYALREIHDRMETQHEIYTTGQKICTDETSAEVRSEKCGTYQKLIITSTLGTLARVIREITLYKNSRTIDFRTVIEDYNSEDDLFTAAFPVDIKGGAVIFDDRFAPHVSTRSRDYMSFRTHQYASFSGCRILPANRWFGTGPSVTVRTGSHGSVNIGMTAIVRKDEPVLRAVADSILKSLTKKGIPVTPYPETEQHGGSKIIHFNEDIYETDTRIVVSLSDSPDLYTQKLSAKFSQKTKKAAGRSIEKNGYAVIFARDSENAWNKPVDVFCVIGKDADTLESLAEKLGEKLSSGYVVNIENCVNDVTPDETDDFGVSIINNGNIACSVEGKNTLNLMLFHTASFYGNAGKVTGGDELVPEKKTHVFTYRLYPHSSSFREAEVYKEADMFNEPLFCVTRESGGTCVLPEKHSFLASPAGFCITAFKAGGYPYASMKRDDAPVEERGLTVRGFECYGTDRTVKIKTGFPASGAFVSDLLDENRQSVKTAKAGITFPAGAHSVMTAGLMTEKQNKEKKIYDAARDLSEPTYVRSWEHDMGAVPTGFLRFAAVLDKKQTDISELESVISLNCVNNSADLPADVRIKISCSRGLSADRRSVRVKLGTGESSVTPITVKKTLPETKGQVTILYEYDGQTFTDVFEFGYFNPTVSLRLKCGKAICTVKNPTDQKLNASLIFVTPFELWNVGGFNPVSYGDSGPLAVPVTLGPYSENEYEFAIDCGSEDFFKAYYAAVKLCCNGRIHFAFADVHGPRHNVWAHEFIAEIQKDNGSIRKLLEM